LFSVLELASFLRPSFFPQSYTLPAYFGGVSLSEENTVTEVKAIALSYFLDVSEDWRAVVGDKWEKKFLEDVQKFADTYYPDLEVSRVTRLGEFSPNG
jgi:hypothetical protein